ncbi:MAG: PmeII family type II restriction endonuclease [Acidobacteriaceae bacterium]
MRTLLENKNPYLFRAKNLNTASDFVTALLEARLSSSEEGSFGNFLESLAVFVATQCAGGQKSPATGIDIDLTKDDVRYLISVKSGKNWGNSSQYKALGQHFADAVKVLKQSKHSGDVQPTLGICYGRSKTVNNGFYLRISGQNFWHLLSGDPALYTSIIEPLGFDAQKHEDLFKEQKSNALNRMTMEFIQQFCNNAGAIDWPRLVSSVSGNLSQ